jgi:hypothetical protein
MQIATRKECLAEERILELILNGFCRLAANLALRIEVG